MRGSLSDGDSQHRTRAASARMAALSLLGVFVLGTQTIAVQAASLKGLGPQLAEVTRVYGPGFRQAVALPLSAKSFGTAGGTSGGVTLTATGFEAGYGITFTRVAASGVSSILSSLGEYKSAGYPTKQMQQMLSSPATVAKQASKYEKDVKIHALGSVGDQAILETYRSKGSLSLHGAMLLFRRGRYTDTLIDTEQATVAISKLERMAQIVDGRLRHAT